MRKRSFLVKLRDLWRGYRDCDIESARMKIDKESKPGGWVELTCKEFKANFKNPPTTIPSGFMKPTWDDEKENSHLPD